MSLAAATGLRRQAGLLLPLFSMPSSRSWGIGEFGDVPVMARWMRDAGMGLLQLLPINEMAPGQSSPYSATSSMALDPIFISIADMPDFQALGGEDALDFSVRGVLAEVRAKRGVDYWAIRTIKDRTLRRCFARFLDREWTRESRRAAELRAYVEEQAWWLDDYAVFRAAHQLSDGQTWRAWEPGMRGRRASAVGRLKREAGLEVLYRQYLQWTAEQQWQAARADAAGIRMVGDFPFGVAADSADVWASQDLFAFDGTVGAPPDAFSDKGQNWQLPVYRWDVMRDRRYAWFGARARRAAALFDAFRVDHVVGLFRSWVFPLDGTPAHFVPGDKAAQIAQGDAVLQVLQASGAAVIAEDLGTIPDFVREDLRRLGIPGYRVMRWERHWKEPGQPFVSPAAYPASSLATTGTHDTDTLASWWEGLDADDRTAQLDVVQPAGLPTDPFLPGIRDALLEALYASGSALLTLPVQDAFGWTDRVNVPALVDDRNWTWKLPWPVDEWEAQPAARERQAALHAWAAKHHRLP
ncbi:MAG: 4-alpha-glucanotransferase [Acidobacteria bacterium]|nr:4-alpha-glucanotransferase [Acidobacteriota bacterium]